MPMISESYMEGAPEHHLPATWYDWCALIQRCSVIIFDRTWCMSYTFLRTTSGLEWYHQ